jgi:hypothetical protein
MDVLCRDLGLVESPRWHHGRLWFSDWIAGQIIAVDDEGESEVMVSHPSLPLCFDFLPDGRPLLVSNQAMALLTVEDDGTLASYADLAALSPFGFNDIVVDGRGHAYVNSGNFEFAAGPPEGPVQPGFVALVRPDHGVRIVAEDLAFPNGMAVTADNGTLVVADSYRTNSSRSTSAPTDRCPVGGCGPTWARKLPTASASTPRAPPGTPTYRTNTACGWPRAARSSTPSRWTAAASPACSAAATGRASTSWPRAGRAWPGWAGTRPGRARCCAPTSRFPGPGGPDARRANLAGYQ